MKGPGEELDILRGQGLLRKLRVLPETSVCFSSNDYLNLSGHPRVIAGAHAALREMGAAAGGSRLTSGNLELHLELERSLAGLVGAESALVFGSGYLANFGVITAIAGRNDTVFSDRLNHSSIVNGILASRATLRRYSHNDPLHLEQLLSRDSGSGRKIVITESVFSMDGDIAPLAELAALADAHECILVVDEAHAVGVFGEGGGVCRSMGILPDVITGTLSKALGSYGGFAACSEELRELMVNRSPSFIYSTALPPASAGAALASLRLIGEDSGPGTELIARASTFRKGLAALGTDTGNSASQIVPLITGTPESAVILSELLSRKGVEVPAIRPPTVPEGTSRLRFSITLAHEPDVLRQALDIIGGAL